MMVVMIVLIVMIAGVIKARVRSGRDWRGRELEDSKDTLTLRDDVRQLKERIAVLERVVTDNHGSLGLDREIERLRDR